jgi:hypothetical protein
MDHKGIRKDVRNTEMGPSHSKGLFGYFQSIWIEVD